MQRTDRTTLFCGGIACVSCLAGLFRNLIDHGIDAVIVSAYRLKASFE